MWIGANKKSGSWRWYGIVDGPVPAVGELDSDWHNGHSVNSNYDCMYYEPNADIGWNANKDFSDSFNFVCERWVI